MKRLLLLGAGHAHLLVLEELEKQRRKMSQAGNGRAGALQVILASPARWQYYSGMIPGWMAGHYRLEQCRIDLPALCKAAGVRFVESPALGLDARRRQVRLGNGEVLDYDLLSLAIGSDTATASLQGGGADLLPIKPFADFVAGWQMLMEQSARRDRTRLLIAGGGAGGVELALAAAHAIQKAELTAEISLAAGEHGVLGSHAPAVRQSVEKELKEAGIRVFCSRATVERDHVALSEGSRLQVDHLVAVTGAVAPAWLHDSGLRLDDAGYVMVDASHRSVSHPDAFAAGDISARQDLHLPKSGVHAVRAGRVLAANLLAAARGAKLKVYRPPRHVLYLLSCGSRRAVMSWGPLSLQGHWAWRWKDAIDRRFIRRFSRNDQ